MTTIVDLLARKEEIDQRPLTGQPNSDFTVRFRWLLEAVEHLLKIEQERGKRQA